MPFLGCSFADKPILEWTLHWRAIKRRAWDRVMLRLLLVMMNSPRLLALACSFVSPISFVRLAYTF